MPTLAILNYFTILVCTYAKINYYSSRHLLFLPFNELKVSLFYRQVLNFTLMSNPSIKYSILFLNKRKKIKK